MTHLPSYTYIWPWTFFGSVKSPEISYLPWDFYMYSILREAVVYKQPVLRQEGSASYPYNTYLNKRKNSF